MTDVKIGPPPSPNREKFPFVGTTNVQGIPINIENLAGSVRQGIDASGNPWSTRMKFHYGEIEHKSLGNDGDKLDVFIGPNPSAKQVYIVNQNHPSDHPKKPGKFDEQKCFIGFDSADAAKRAYYRQYDRPGEYFRSITSMTIDQFKKSLDERKTQAKIAEVREKADKEKRPSAFIRMKLRGNGADMNLRDYISKTVKEAELSKTAAPAPVEAAKKINWADLARRAAPWVAAPAVGAGIGAAMNSEDRGRGAALGALTGLGAYGGYRAGMGKARGLEGKVRRGSEHAAAKQLAGHGSPEKQKELAEQIYTQRMTRPQKTGPVASKKPTGEVTPGTLQDWTNKRKVMGTGLGLAGGAGALALGNKLKPAAPPPSLLDQLSPFGLSPDMMQQQLQQYGPMLGESMGLAPEQMQAIQGMQGMQGMQDMPPMSPEEQAYYADPYTVPPEQAAY